MRYKGCIKLILLSNLIKTKIAITEIVASYAGLVLLADSRIRKSCPDDFVGKRVHFFTSASGLLRWRPTL
jgi:hypothetical protein